MNSGNLGARIMENGAWNQKIWALEAFRGKMVFLGGSGGNSGIFGVVGGSWRKRKGLLQNLDFFRGFLWIFCSVWSGLGHICNYFSELMGPSTNFPARRERG
jgi:hypothetical protein